MEGMLKAKESLRKAGNILVACHINPDGDTVGSMLALGLGLEKMGKKIVFFSADGVPKAYRRLPGADRVITRLHQAKGRFDLAVAVDCGYKHMLGGAWAVFKKARNILEIDHHAVRESFGTISLLDTKAAAVGEMIYCLLKVLRVSIDKDIAENILTSVIVETNSFRLPTVRSLSFSMCGELMKTGMDFYRITHMVYWAKKKESVVLSGICLSRCKFLHQETIVWSIIRKKDLDRVGGQDEDVDAVADEMRSIEGIKVAVLFREKSQKVLRVSLRSKDSVNVAAIAEHFAGGGHFDVAGCLIPNNRQAMRELLNLTENLLSEYQSIIRM
ncbi:MAG: DHH family phosphoesterase [Candidatus Omnitrophota bacterium]